MNYYDEETRVQIINNKINNEIGSENSINKHRVLKMEF